MCSYNCVYLSAGINTPSIRRFVTPEEIKCLECPLCPSNVRLASCTSLTFWLNYLAILTPLKIKFRNCPCQLNSFRGVSRWPPAENDAILVLKGRLFIFHSHFAMFICHALQTILFSTLLSRTKETQLTFFPLGKELKDWASIALCLNLLFYVN